MVKWKLEDMHCEVCVGRITKAMEAEGYSFEISLPEQSITVNEPAEKHEEIKELLDDLGFEAVAFE